MCGHLPTPVTQPSLLAKTYQGNVKSNRNSISTRSAEEKKITIRTWRKAARIPATNITNRRWYPNCDPACRSTPQLPLKKKSKIRKVSHGHSILQSFNRNIRVKVSYSTNYANTCMVFGMMYRRCTGMFQTLKKCSTRTVQWKRRDGLLHSGVKWRRERRGKETRWATKIIRTNPG